MFNKLINWFFYQIKLRQEIADNQLRKEYASIQKQIQKSIKTEIKKRCTHEHLKQVNGVYYRCTKRGCNTLVNLSDAPMYDKPKFIESHKELIEKLEGKK